VVIAGKPNVGKSSLFNALVGAGRAIVTPTAGTTRDLVTETADVEGLRLELVDTAGVRDTHDEVEREGVARARRAWESADLTLVVLDASQELDAADFALLVETERLRRIVVANKRDLPPAWTSARFAPAAADVSSKTGAGLGRLREEIRAALDGGNPDIVRDTAAVTNVRHAALVDRARTALRGALDSLQAPGGPVAEEFVLTDLHDARVALEEVTGKRTSDDLLRHIFSKFCIGK
jgi:tRNA modification GTPase